MPIKIALVEDNRRARESLSLALSLSPEIQCVGAYASAEEALRGIPAAAPQVILMDIHLPRMSGIVCTTRLKTLLPRVQILMLTRFEDSQTIFEALRAGASGYLVKNTPTDGLIEAVKQVAEGGAPMSMQIARKVIAHFQLMPQTAGEVDCLTAREHDVLRLLAKGSRYKNIADALGITMNTLRTHVRAIYDKLHVHSRTEAAMKLVAPDRLE